MGGVDVRVLGRGTSMTSQEVTTGNWGGRIRYTSDLGTATLIMSLIGVLFRVLARVGASMAAREAGLIGM